MDGTPSANPVTRARRLVEAEIPEAQRGPGWARHWRELEAYAEAPGEWSLILPEDESDQK